MDKQQAVAFIQRELQNNRSQAEIVQALSHQLGAPPDVVSKFVAQIAAQQPAPPPPPPPVSTPPAGVPPASLGQSLDQQMSDFEDFDDFGSSDGLPMPGQFASSDTGMSSPSFQSTPAAGAAYQQAAAPAPAQAPASAAPPPAPTPTTSGMTLEQAEQDEALEKLVVNALGKGRKHSDVVLAVCERTGMDWDGAQRLVSRVSAKNRKKLATQQNLIIIPLSIAALLGGLALLAAAGTEAYELGAAVQGVGNNPVAVSGAEAVIREVIWAVATGGALTLGGAAGLILALKKQFEH